VESSRAARRNELQSQLSQTILIVSGVRLSVYMAMA